MISHVQWHNPLESWEFLKFWKEYFEGPLHGLTGTNVFPPSTKWFRALELTPFDKVKCVILGQDPYHTKGMADGLAFSVMPHVKPLPPSLRNLFAEYQSDLGYPHPRTGSLETWARNGVLLLNTILTVEQGKPLSHEHKGWEKLSIEITRALQERGRVAFLLMGKKASEFIAAESSTPTIRVPHPSPFSASKGFFGSRPFSRVNQALQEIGASPVDWRLP